MDFTLRVLGTSAAMPAHGRNLSAQLLTLNSESYLIDCGEGTQFQLQKYGVKMGKIKHIFISHLHGDHLFGLPGLLKTLHLKGRKQPLYIYGPKGLEEYVRHNFSYTQTTLRYELDFIVTNPVEFSNILTTDSLEVYTIPLQHRVPCNGYLFRELARKPKIKKSIIDELNLSVKDIKQIKNRKDFVDAKGRLHKWETLTIPLSPIRSFAYCSDTLYSSSVLSYIQNVDLLYHEATFTHDLEKQAKKTMHTTAAQAARLAKAAGVNQLLIGHFSPRYQDLSPLLIEAKAYFERTIVTREGDLIHI